MMSKTNTQLDKVLLTIKRIQSETSAIKSYELVAKDGETLPKIEAGAHLVFHLDNGLTRYYSLYDSPGDSQSYHVAVLKDVNSRGGSEFIHDNFKTLDQVLVSGPKNNFPVSDKTKKAVLIAGGIGVTPIISMARHCFQNKIPLALHYCARARDEAAFVELLEQIEPYRDQVTFHFDGGDPTKGVDLSALLQTYDEGTHLYCCGPDGLMNAVEKAASHWPSGTVHFERFKATSTEANETANKPFKVVLKRSNVALDVPADQSILQVLRNNGFEMDSVCEEGICGSCLTDVLAGELDHRDQILTAEEKADNDVIAICCSRAKSDELILDI